MPGPSVSIDLAIIEANARLVASACGRAGVSVFGVTKGTCGMPQVARAMLRGGVDGIAESRFENIRRLRESGIDAPILLLRSPPLSHVEEVIASVDVSLNSELTTIAELSRVAARMSRVHDIILMVDLGDLREGIWPDELDATVEQVLALPGIRLAGIGTNLTCFGAILPSEENMGALATHAAAIESRFDLRLRYVSGGNSSSLPLLLKGGMPAGINNLRIGEAILQGGRDTFLDAPATLDSAGAHLDRDAFVLKGELLEVKLKPSMPIGNMGRDAFGRRPVFIDRGERLRGILNIGREDVAVEGLIPIDEGISVLGASSDHLIVDLTEAKVPRKVGDRLGFRMSYGALLAAMTSEYVEKLPMLDKDTKKPPARVQLLAPPPFHPFIRNSKLKARLGALGLAVGMCETPSEGPETADGVAASLGEGAVPLLLGEDHRTSLLGLTGLARGCDSFGLLWLDAIPCLLPAGAEAPDEDPARAPFRRVLAQALGYDPTVKALTPRLSPETTVLIGLRDVAPSEAELIARSRLGVFTIADVDALGIREVMRQALARALAGTRGFYVSYSPEVTDIPGSLVGSGGITLRETHQAMEIIAATRSLLAMDVVGFGGAREPRVMAEAAGFILSAFGKRIL